MRRNLQNLHAVRAKAPGFRLADTGVDARNAPAILSRPHHLGAELFLEGEIAAAMIQMVMGIEDMGELQPPCRQRFAHRSRLGRIDHGAKPGTVGDQIGVIVLQAGNERDADFGHFWVPFLGSA